MIPIRTIRSSRQRCLHQAPAGATRQALVECGYTLIELIVVMILLTVAAAIVAPTLLPPGTEPSSSLRAVVGSAREIAVRRGEMIRLHIDRSGAWYTSVGSSPPTEVLMSGRLSDPRGVADLLFSPLGTCAPIPETLPALALPGLDPLTCATR